MGENQKPLLTRRVLMRTALASCLIAVLAWARPAGAVEAPPAAETPPAALASSDGLMAKVKAEHPDAQILKIELLRGEQADLPEWIYEVKLFPPDGRILRLTYDARTLALVEAVGGGHACRHGGRHGEGSYGDGPRRLRMRRGW